MNRRTVLGIPIAVAGACSSIEADTAMRTQWRVRLSEGFDALAFLGPLSGKPFYARYYEAEIAAFKPRLSTALLDAVDSLFVEADADGYLLWPLLTLIFSGAPEATIAQLIASLDAAETALRPPLEAGVYWDAQDWRRFLAARPRLSIVLQGLQDAGFADFRNDLLAPHAAIRQRQLSTLLSGLDVIKEQERVLGRRLEPLVEVNLLWFCRPHGVKVQGQRFLAHIQSSDDTLVLTAAHEILHPPFDMNGAAARACLATLKADPLLARILNEKSKDSGYNTLEGVLEEDTVQALDQIIQERLGFGQPPSLRWTTSDQGMHVLAAGLYGLLKADGFDRTGGNIEAWMQAAAGKGRLVPRVLHEAAAKVMKRPVESLWVTPTANQTDP